MDGHDPKCANLRALPADDIGIVNITVLLHILLDETGSAPIRIRKQQNRLIAPSKRTSRKRVREIRTSRKQHCSYGDLLVQKPAGQT